MVCRAHPGSVLVVVGMQLDFQAFVGSLWARCADHVWDASWPRQRHSLIFRHFLAISRTRCVGHVQDTAWPWQGQSLIFRQFWAVSGTRCTGHVQDVTGRILTFRPRLGRVLDTVGMQPNLGICRQFVGTVCRACPGCIQAVAGMTPNFQALLCNFWDSACWPCRDTSWPRDASRLPGIFRRFLELDVQAMFGMRLVHDKDATWFLGSFRDTMCRPCPGCCKDTS
ncbi:Hypothetical predicted protein [Olea europaea subsp. europaea]|uniref:Uncharacterized protein n=1 Tax=Olea europaea subsp. europaea TaxID=158383 RepID=A0A8S0U9F6_OLEEU|nr:Hypothetical predicted protein [Olea europaea subsp. europaea]